MISLKIAVLGMMISSSLVPLHNGNSNNTINYPAVPKAVNYTIPNKIFPRIIAPAHQDTTVPDITKKKAPVIYTINKNKTHEQCMREAFEYIYAEVNRLLDEEVNQCAGQFWLQKKML
jgi:hypothetical protein